MPPIFSGFRPPVPPAPPVAELDPDGPPDPADDQRVRNYFVVGFVALMAMLLIFASNDQEMLGLLTAAVATAGLLLRWSSSPVLVILMCGYKIYTGPGDPALIGWHRPDERSAMQFLDCVLILAMMAYLIAQYRLLSLFRQAMPLDPRLTYPQMPQAVLPSQRGVAAADPGRIDHRVRRSPVTVTDDELPQGLILGLVVGVAAPVVVFWLRRFDPGLNVPRGTAQFFLLVWMLGVIGIVVSAVLGYLALRRASVEEARQYLQDTLWQETAREQARIRRWTVWKRNRENRS